MSDAEEREENANGKTRSKRKSVSQGESFQDVRKGNSEELSEKKRGGGEGEKVLHPKVWCLC